MQDFIPAPFDIATCMFYTGVDPFTKKPVFIAKGLRDRKTQRALMQFFKSENYFEVRKALEEAGRQDLIGSGCDSLIPARAPKEALEARRQDATKRFRGDYVHEQDESLPQDSGESGIAPAAPRNVSSKKPQKQSRFAPGKGYRPDRKK